MTMEGMENYLRAAGFEVERDYHSREKLYSFRIAKDGCSVTKLFEYPDDRSRVSKAQEDFLDKILHLYLTKSAVESEHTSKEDIPLYESTKEYIRDVTPAIQYYGRTNGKTMYDTQLMMYKIMQHGVYIPKIKNVIFNDPATIVFWADNTKTVVKCQNYDTFDPEKGLAMAIAKKALGNQGNYYNSIGKWTDKYEKPEEPESPWEAFVRLFLNPTTEEIRNEPSN